MSRIGEYCSVIGVDAMGGEGGPNIMVPAIKKLSQIHPEVMFVVFGTQEDVHDRLKGINIGSVVTKGDITDDIKFPTKNALLRGIAKGRESSIVQMINMLHDGDLNATIGRGNTSAYVGYAMNKLKHDTYTPALSCWIPRVDRNNLHQVQRDALLMDVGATFNTTPEILLNNVELGLLALRNIEKPRIALLNAGIEEYKGDDAYLDAFKVLRTKYGEQFLGNIEPDSLLVDTRPDLIICGGMFGNGVLKGMEGTFKTTTNVIKKEVFGSPIGKILGAYTGWKIKKGLGRFNPDKRGDGILHGVHVPNNGTVVKIHGSASQKGVIKAASTTINRLRVE